MEVTQFLQLDIAAAIGLISSTGYLFFYKFLYKKMIKPRNELINAAVRSMPKIDKMHAEFYVNGGGSMTDRMIRMENMLISVSQKQHAYLLEHELGIYETDANGNCVGVNRTYCKITGRTMEESLGTGWIQSIHPEDAEKVVDHWNECIDGKRDFRLHYRMVNIDDEVVDVLGTAHPMRNPYTKEVIGYMGSVKVMDDENN
jgi:PAS domain S-box-containing protein